MGSFLRKKNTEDLYYIFIMSVVILYLFRKSLDIFFIADDTDWIILARFPMDSAFFIRRTGLAVFRPVINVLFFLEYRAFGLHYPLYHLANIFFHAANTLLIYFLLRHFLKEKKYVFLASLFFAVSYSHHQAVIWVGAIVDEVVAFFYLLAMILFLKFRSGKQARYLACSLAMFGLALGSKESAITLPLTLFLMEAVLLKERLPLCLKHALPYLAAAVLYLFAMKILFPDFSSRALSTASDFAIGIHFLPNTLSCLVQLFYPLLGVRSSQGVVPDSFAIPGTLAVVFLLLALVVRLTVSGRKDMLVLFLAGMALTAVTILPVSFFHSMMRFGSFTRFRYLYLPSAVFSIAVASFFAIVFHTRNQKFLIEKVFVSLVMGYIFIVNVPAHEKIIKEYTLVANEQKRIIEAALNYSAGTKERENTLFLAGFPFSFKYIYEPHMKNALNLYTKKNWDVFWLAPGERPPHARQKGLFLFPELLR